MADDDRPEERDATGNEANEARSARTASSGGASEGARDGDGVNSLEGEGERTDLDAFDSRGHVSVDDVVVFAGSDGTFCTERQLRRRLAVGEWRLCLQERPTGRWIVETDTSGLLVLEPTSVDALPAWAEPRFDGFVLRIADTRRALPPGRPGVDS